MNEIPSDSVLFNGVVNVSIVEYNNTDINYTSVYLYLL